MQAGAPIPTSPNVYIDPSNEQIVYVGSAGGYKVDDFSISRMLETLVQVRMLIHSGICMDRRGINAYKHDNGTLQVCISLKS